MTKQEQNLLDAAREIVYDFNYYGEVLQTGDNGEYGTESSIGMLSAAIHQYKDGTPAEPQHGREPDKMKPLAQYLDEYIQHSILIVGNYSLQPLLKQALDAYESTENVKIKIKRNVI